MKSNFILLIFIIIFLFTINTQATVKIEPSRIILYGDPGTRTTGTINVFNPTDVDTEVRAVLQDWNLDEEESLLTFKAGETDSSLAGLIKFNPKQFIIKPGELQVVRFTITVPEDIKKERRGIVFFEEKTDMIEDKTGARVVTQIGTTIYFMPSNAVSKFGIPFADVHLAEDEEDENVALLLAENAGDVHIRYRINYKIINDKGVLISKDELAEKLILPNKKQGIGFPFEKDLEPGNYKLLISVSFQNSDKNTEHSVSFEVKK